LTLLSTFAVFSQTLGPAETVSAFYKYSDARSSTFDRRHIESRKQWYTPQLYQAFRIQLRKDQAHLKKHPTDKPFFGDGLDFQPLNEACDVNGKRVNRRRSVGRTNIRQNRADVNVRFAYPKGCAIEPIIWRFRLWKVGGKWLIGDQIYEDGSTLTKDINENKYY
jgi:hypothetical protein